MLNPFKIFLFVLVCSFSSQSLLANNDNSQIIFRCKTPMLSLDLNFEQGSDVYLDIYFDKKMSQAAVVSRPAVGPAVVILKLQESVRAYVDIESSSAFFSWEVNSGEKVVASLGYMGEFWGFHMGLSEDIFNRDPSLKIYKEVELFCTEGSVFEEFFLN